jgi:3-hydroxyisobutyrate dehydrogenase-like beta-hydroxyacid dehydrogenase
MSNLKFPISISALRSAIERLRQQGVSETTTEKVIVEIEGEYAVDKETPVNDSRNAAVGRHLAAHAKQLRIVEKLAKQRFRAADGSRSCCSVWTILA